MFYVICLWIFLASSLSDQLLIHFLDACRSLPQRTSLYSSRLNQLLYSELAQLQGALLWHPWPYHDLIPLCLSFCWNVWTSRGQMSYIVQSLFGNTYNQALNTPDTQDITINRWPESIGEIVQGWWELADLVEDPDSVASTHVIVHHHL